jgi:nicotinate phosphoribosyltransferase
VIALEDEQVAGEPLLVPALREGKRVGAVAPLAELQKRCQSQIERLPAEVRALAVSSRGYSVRHSARLEALLEEVRERIARTVARS